MKTLRQALEDYLALRRAMGFKLSEAGTLLPQFVEFLDQQGPHVHHHGMGRGVGDPTPSCPTRRMGEAPALGAGLCALPQRHRPPYGDPADRSSCRTVHSVASPYLYSDAEIAQLLTAASHLPSATGLRASHLHHRVRLAGGHRHAHQ